MGRSSFKEKIKKIPEHIWGSIVFTLLGVGIVSLLAIAGSKSPPDFYRANLEIAPTVNGSVVEDHIGFKMSVQQKKTDAYAVGGKIPCGLYKIQDGSYVWSPISLHETSDVYYAVDTGRITEIKEGRRNEIVWR